MVGYILVGFIGLLLRGMLRLGSKNEEELLFFCDLVVCIYIDIIVKDMCYIFI